MGVMTLADFQSDLAEALGGRTLDATRSARWVNNAYREVAYAFKFPELNKTATFNTVDGTESYTLATIAADFRAMDEEGLRITAPQTRFLGALVPETRINYRRASRFPQTATRGQPRWWHRFSGKIYLRPIPDSTVMTMEFDYWAKVTALAAAGDTTVLTDDWDDVIFRAALYRGQMSYGEHDRMINTFNMFLGLLRSRVMAEDLEEFPDGGISAIQSSYDYNTR